MEYYVYHRLLSSWLARKADFFDISFIIISCMCTLDDTDIRLSSKYFSLFSFVRSDALQFFSSQFPAAMHALDPAKRITASNVLRYRT